MRYTVLPALVLVAVVLGAAAPVYAQETTERYIPIGKSPGLSGKYTYIGPIRGVGTEPHRLTVGEGASEMTVEVNERTRIWLDRSGMKKTNLGGGVEDCKPGRTVEIKFADPDTKRVADWIKVRIEQP